MARQQLETAGEDMLGLIQAEAIGEPLEDDGDAGPQELSEEEIQTIAAAAVDDAISYSDSEISPLRALATRFYKGEEFEDDAELEGRSKFISRDVHDTIQAQLPQWLRSFFQAKRIARYMPLAPQHEQMAKDATTYAWWLLQNHMDGFNLLHSTFKDAAKQKCGVIKVWWEQSKKATVQTFAQQSDEALALLLSEPGAELNAVDRYPNPLFSPEYPMEPEFLNDAEIRFVTESGKIRADVLPPEEFLIDRNARGMAPDKRYMIAHRTYKSVSELVGMGYDYDEMLELAGEDSLIFSQTALARNSRMSTLGMSNMGNDAMRYVEYIEVDIGLDLDGDGIAEQWTVCLAGPGRRMVGYHPTEAIYCDFHIDPEPHTFYGQDTFDAVGDIQLVKSKITRAVLDSLAQSINPRTAVVEGMVNMEDVLNNEVGAVVRTRSLDAIRDLSTPFVGQPALPILEYLDNVKENRTGISEAAMGLDPNALQSSTKSAVDRTISMGQGHVELQVRLLAAGLQKLFKAILFFVCKYQDRAHNIQLADGKWHEMDPRGWDADMAVFVDLNIGQGDEAQQISVLTMMAQKQEQILQLLGPNNPLCTLAQYSRTLRKLAELSGVFPDDAFNEVPADWQPPPQEPKPDPAVILAQAQAQQIQADIENNQRKVQADLIKTQTQAETDRMRLAQERDLETQRMELDAVVRLTTAAQQGDAARAELIVKSVMDEHFRHLDGRFNLLQTALQGVMQPATAPAEPAAPSENT